MRKTCSTCRYQLLDGLSEPCRKCVNKGEWQPKEPEQITCSGCKYSGQCSTIYPCNTCERAFKDNYQKKKRMVQKEYVAYVNIFKSGEHSAGLTKYETKEDAIRCAGMNMVNHHKIAHKITIPYEVEE